MGGGRRKGRGRGTHLDREGETERKRKRETVRERQRSGERHREARNRRIDGKTDRLIGRETHIVIMTEIIQDGRAGERALRAP